MSEQRCVRTNCVDGRLWIHGNSFPCVCQAEAAPPRATTPEPMTEGRLAAWRSIIAGDDRLAKCGELLAEIDRLRAPIAGSPTRESGALWTLLEAAYAERDAGSRGRYPAQIALDKAIATLMAEREQAADNFDMMTEKWGESEAALSTLERDAARMREALQFIYDALDNFNENEAFRMAGLTLAALSPSGDTETTP